MPRSMPFAALAAAVLLAACGPPPKGDDPCPGLTQCGAACVDLNASASHCGACGNACDSGTEICVAGECLSTAGPCQPGITGACYYGPSGTEGVGRCQAGTRTCLADETWGPCHGEVTPIEEICFNEIDDNCNGEIDEDHDLDGDGWTRCMGDCCDSVADGCTEPHLVNPGAFDVPGNDLDDDCDGVVDNAVLLCDDGLASNSGDPMDFARAMDLCQTASENAPLPERRWGVISAEFFRADGTGAPAVDARAIRPRFGTGTLPQHGSSLAMLSTGNAAGVGDVNPSYHAFQTGRRHNLTSGFPADWLALNGGVLPNAPGCPRASGTDANDPIMLKLRIRVPTNARSFSVNTNFFSAEYPEFVCSAFNDFFVALLDSSYAGTPANPADKNLAVYEAPGGELYPVGVNLAFGDTGLFRECLNGPTGCTRNAVAGSTTMCTSTDGLVGTGMDVENPPTIHPSIKGWCDESNLAGGGTGWLTTRGNVVPGEIIELRFVIWDTVDGYYDSVVLLDNFQWSLEAAEPGTVVIN
jgi:hypothetical protein